MLDFLHLDRKNWVSSEVHRTQVVAPAEICTGRSGALMILKISCPSCQKAYRLTPPYPPPGKRYRCTCQKVITVTYPPELSKLIEEDKSPVSANASGSGTTQDIPYRTDERAKRSVAEKNDFQATVRNDSEKEADAAAMPKRGRDVEQAVLSKDEEETQITQPTTPVRRLPAKPEAKRPRPVTIEASRDPVGKLEVSAPPTRSALGSSPPARSALGSSPPASSALGSSPPARSALGSSPPARSALGSSPPARSALSSSSDQKKRDTSKELPRPETKVSRASAVPKIGASAAPGKATSRAERTKKKSSSSPSEEPPAPKTRSRRRWPYFLAIAFLVMAIFGAATVGGTIWYFSRDLPGTESLVSYEPPIPTQIYAGDGQLIGEFFGEERRYVIAYEDIPQQVINAFVAAEDATFFEHHGIDYTGIVRAMIANIREQRLAQGASTITQQVTRSFLLTREKKIKRKIIEALLAYRIENNFSKEHILYLYLNQIYLGEGAYGVAAAAKVYFGKDVRDLDLAETSLLAGLPPAPSRYSPLLHFKAAKDRQRYVLHSMAKQGYISQEEAAAAEKAELELIARKDRVPMLAPYVTEHVRRYLVSKYGDDMVLTGGLQVHTTINLELQQAAQAAVREGVRVVDHRIGFRGAPDHISESEIEAWKKKYDTDLKQKRQESRPGGVERYGPPPEGLPVLAPEEVHKGVVVAVDRKYAKVDIGSQKGIIAIKSMSWAYPVNPSRNWKYRELDRVDSALKVGDVLNVRIKALSYPKASVLVGDEAKDLMELVIEQEPAVEGSLFAYSPVDGSVIAMVGGYDYERSEFNRPFQAKRQMGSAFKPLIYAAALDHPDKVYTPATIVLDAPITLHKESEDPEDPILKELWKPSNYGKDYLGNIMLREALYRSRNTVAVRVLHDIGLDYAYDYVTKLGIESHINKDTSMVLGTSSVTLYEMCRAFSAFASGGYTVEPVFIDRILDRRGKVLEQKAAQPEKKEVMPASTAYIMTSMLKDVVQMGTAVKARVLKKPVAGKTGTTNDFVDASFMGYTPQLVAGTWIGYDQPKSMGYGETGGDAALPPWIAFMKEALKVYPETDYKVPEDVVYAAIDPKTGKLASESTEMKVRLPFLKGEEPVETAPAPGQIGTEDFLSADEAL